MRWLADLLVPIVAVSRWGFLLGWVGRDRQGRRYAHIERMFMRPGARGVPNTWLKHQLHDQWNARCRRRGIVLIVTRIRTNRPQLLDMIQRFGGYRVHHADPLLTYLHLRLDSPKQMQRYYQARLNARIAYEKQRKGDPQPCT